MEREYICILILVSSPLGTLYSDLSERFPIHNAYRDNNMMIFV